MCTRKTGHPVTTRKYGFCVHLYSKTFYMLPSLLILALFIVDPDAIIAKGEDLLSLEEIRQSIMHIKVLVVRVSEL